MKRYLRYPGWKRKAVTLSYDDAVVEDIRLVEIMKKYGLKGTFNVNSGQLDCGVPRRMSSATAVKLYRDAGMEVAMHGYEHGYIPGMTGADVINEFYRDKLGVEKIFGCIVRGGACAFGQYDDQTINVLKALGIKYFRTTKSTHDFDIPTDWLRMPITCRHGDPRLFELVDEFINRGTNYAVQYKPMLFYLMGHSYEFEDNNNWEIIEKFGQKMSECDDIWHATNIEIYDYVKAYNDLEFSTDGTKVLNNSSIDVYLLKDGENVLAKANSISEI